MQNEKEIAKEVLRRAVLVKERRRQKRRRVWLTAGTGVAACAVLAVYISNFGDIGLDAELPAEATAQAAEQAAAQTMMMFPDAGGYVIGGLICFVIGVGVTLLCLRKIRGRGK
jgi:hypothetical protein